jgi:hypothetical protein
MISIIVREISFCKTYFINNKKAFQLVSTFKEKKINC